MTGQEARPESSDPWTVWFSRIVQIVGLVIVVEQLVVGQGSPDRPWILMIAVAMMLGGIGLQLLLKAVLRIGGSQ